MTNSTSPVCPACHTRRTTPIGVLDRRILHACACGMEFKTPTALQVALAGAIADVAAQGIHLVRS